MNTGKVWAWPWSAQGPIRLSAFLGRLVWACVAPMIVLAGYLGWEHLRSLEGERARDAEQRARNVSTIIDTHLAAEITSLQLLAGSDHMEAGADLSRLHEEATRFRAGFDGHIIVSDTAGQMLINTRVPYGKPLPRLPVSRGRSAFPLAVSTAQPAVGDIVQGPVANQPLVAIAVPVVRGNAVTRVVLGTLEMSHFQKHFDAIAIPGDWMLELTDGNGQLMARRGSPATEIGSRHTVRLTNAAWSVAITTPATANRNAMLLSAAAIAATTFAAALVSLIGGRRASRTLERAISTLSDVSAKVPPDVQTIAEIDAIRSRMREAAASLKASEDRFRDLFMSNPHPMWVWDRETLAIVAVNDAAVSNYGYSREEWLSMTLKDFRPEEEVPRLLEEVARVTDGIDNIGIWLHRKKDGTIISAEVVWHSVRFEGRRCELALSTDITARLRAEALVKEYIGRLETAVMGTVNAVSRMLEMRDPYTAGHQHRVGELAAAIAAEMGKDEEFQRGLRIAGSLHDIGKIVVPAEILSMPRRLSDVEYRMVQIHPQQGYEILKDIEFPWPVAEVAHQHHERIDGSGYPRGLRGEEISLSARISAVADVVESMASHRPYRAALGVEVALAEVEKGRGRIYDADAADACLRLFREKGYRLPA